MYYYCFRLFCYCKKILLCENLSPAPTIFFICVNFLLLWRLFLNARMFSCSDIFFARCENFSLVGYTNSLVVNDAKQVLVDYVDKRNVASKISSYFWVCLCFNQHELIFISTIFFKVSIYFFDNKLERFYTIQQVLQLSWI